MPEIAPLLPSVPLAPPQRLCASEELAEKGKAIVFDVLHYREPARGFAMRFDGKVVAYLNRCVHVPTEMDWQPGEFLDAGEVVLAGSFTRPVEITRGDTFHADYGQFGSVSCQFV